MKHVDVVELTRESVAQTMGTDYMEKLGDFSAIDSYKLTDVGRDVLQVGTVDVYSKKLLGQLAKLVVDEKKYEASGIKGIFVDSFDWGSFVERVYFAPQDIIEDDMWNLIDGKVYENDHKFFAPKVSAKIFEEAKSITTPISIVEDQLKTAFTSWDEMNKFLSGIRTTVENTIQLGLQAYAHMLISCGIAVSVAGTSTAVHLVTEAIAKGLLESGATADDFRKSEECAIFAMERMKTIRDNMRVYNSAYNDGTIPTFTSDEDNKLIMLSQFENFLKFTGKRQVYNLGEIGFGDYDTTPMWQGFRATSGDEGSEVVTNFDWNTVSSVAIKADASNKLGIGTNAFDQSNVAAVIYDHRAMGVCPYRRKVTSQYTASADFWNEFHHLLVNYILDSKFSIVALVLD
jgi:hypothetical protein